MSQPSLPPSTSQLSSGGANLARLRYSHKRKALLEALPSLDDAKDVRSAYTWAVTFEGTMVRVLPLSSRVRSNHLQNELITHGRDFDHNPLKDDAEIMALLRNARESIFHLATREWLPNASILVGEDDFLVLGLKPGETLDDAGARALVPSPSPSIRIDTASLDSPMVSSLATAPPMSRSPSGGTSASSAPSGPELEIASSSIAPPVIETRSSSLLSPRQTSPSTAPSGSELEVASSSIAPPGIQTRSSSLLSASQQVATSSGRASTAAPLGLGLSTAQVHSGARVPGTAPPETSPFLSISTHSMAPPLSVPESPSVSTPASALAPEGPSVSTPASALAQESPSADVSASADVAIDFARNVWENWTRVSGLSCYFITILTCVLVQQLRGEEGGVHASA
jgi:hypothetical protein